MINIIDSALEEFSQRHNRKLSLLIEKPEPPYSIDACIPELNVAIEINGIFHYKSIKKDLNAKSLLKNKFLESLGYTVVNIDSYHLISKNMGRDYRIKEELLKALDKALAEASQKFKDENS